MRFFKRPQYKFKRATSNIIISLGVAAAVVLILWQAGLAVIFNNFPVDRSGNVAPVAVFGGTGGVFTAVSSVDPLPVTTGAPTASTDPLGWGQAFFPSNVKGGQAGACTIESSLNIVCKEPTASVNALNSNDGGRIYRQLSTGLVAGSVHNTAHTVGGGVIFMTGSAPAANFRRSVNSGATWVVAATPPPTTGTAAQHAGRMGGAAPAVAPAAKPPEYPKPELALSTPKPASSASPAGKVAEKAVGRAPQSTGVVPAKKRG